jgi:hypothetical protein
MKHEQQRRRRGRMWMATQALERRQHHVVVDRVRWSDATPPPQGLEQPADRHDIAGTGEQLRGPFRAAARQVGVDALELDVINVRDQAIAHDGLRGDGRGECVR